MSKTQDPSGCWHIDPIDVKRSAALFTFTLELLRQIRRDVGVAQNNKTLESDEMTHALSKLKQTFEQHFMRNTDLQKKKTEIASLHGKQKASLRKDSRGAFKAWCRSLLGDYSVVLAILRHGIFDFSDLERCATFLRTERETRAAGAGGVAQPARNHALRKQALQARRAIRDARKWRDWQKDGWQLKPSQNRQAILFENGELEKRMRDTNASYEFGLGADGHLSKERAMTLDVFTMQDLNSYFAT